MERSKVKHTIQTTNEFFSRTSRLSLLFRQPFSLLSLLCLQAANSFIQMQEKYVNSTGATHSKDQGTEHFY